MKHIAQGLAALGRGEDKMLVHMTPGEVAGLQKLALAHGGSLTINPRTGLPEAGFLSSILPMAIGAGLTFASGGTLAPWAAGLMVGGGYGLATGSLSKGLMAGLGAYAGGGLGAAADASGALSGMGGAANAAPATAASPVAANTAIQSAPWTIPGEGALSEIAAGSPNGFNLYPNPMEMGGAPSMPGLTNTEPHAFGPGADPYEIDGAVGSRTEGMELYNRPSIAEQSNAYEVDNVGNRSEGMETYSRPSFMEALKQQFPSKGEKLAAGLGALSPIYSMDRPGLKGIPGAGPTARRKYEYSPGERNPRFGEPGEPYFVGQGYTDKGTYYAAAGGDIKTPFDDYSDPNADLEAQVRKLSNSQLDLLTEEADDPMTQAAALKEYYRRAATQRPAKSSFLKMAEGGSVSPYFQQLQNNAGATNDYINQLNASLVPSTQPGGIGSLAAAPKQALAPSTVPSPFSRISDAAASPTLGGFFSRAAGTFDSLNAPSPGKWNYDPATKTYTPPPPAPTPENVEAPSAGRNAYDGDYAGGLKRLAGGGATTYAAAGRLLRGAGDGMSDSIPAQINGGGKTQKAALADGEFVVPADVVSHLGNGSTEAGAKRLYNMMDKVRKARTGRKQQAPAVNAKRMLPA